MTYGESWKFYAEIAWLFLGMCVHQKKERFRDCIQIWKCIKFDHCLVEQGSYWRIVRWGLLNDSNVTQFSDNLHQSQSDRTILPKNVGIIYSPDQLTVAQVPRPWIAWSGTTDLGEVVRHQSFHAEKSQFTRFANIWQNLLALSFFHASSFFIT